jgi:hypothetical protein
MFIGSAHLHVDVGQMDWQALKSDPDALLKLEIFALQ